MGLIKVCENVGRAGNKRFKDVECKFRKLEEESLLHIWSCEKTLKRTEAIWVKEVDEWLHQGEEDGDIKEILIKTLSGGQRLGLCRYARQFKKVSREELGSNEYERKS